MEFSINETHALVLGPSSAGKSLNILTILAEMIREGEGTDQPKAEPIRAPSSTENDLGEQDRGAQR